MKTFDDRKKDAVLRIMARTTIDEETGCYLCGGWNSGNGYAKVRVAGVHWMVHRFMYEFFKGSLKSYQQVDHKCCNRACWNPKHLQAVTNLKNQQLRAKRTRKKKREANKGKR